MIIDRVLRNCGYVPKRVLEREISCAREREEVLQEKLEAEIKSHKAMIEGYTLWRDITEDDDGEPVSSRFKYVAQGFHILVAIAGFIGACFIIAGMAFGLGGVATAMFTGATEMVYAGAGFLITGGGLVAGMLIYFWALNKWTN